MHLFCSSIFGFAVLMTAAFAASRLQTLCTQMSGMWFNTSETCVVMTTAQYSWNDGWDYCASYNDTANDTSTIEGRLAQLADEGERTTLVNMITASSAYLGVGAFVDGSGNVSYWNWCDTKECGRNGSQPMHPITINMSGAIMGGTGDCGEMKKNNPNINRVTCDVPPRPVACQYFMGTTTSSSTTTSTTTTTPTTTASTTTPTTSITSTPTTTSTTTTTPTTSATTPTTSTTSTPTTASAISTTTTTPMTSTSTTTPTTTATSTATETSDTTCDTLCSSGANRPFAFYTKLSSSAKRIVLHQYSNFTIMLQCVNNCYNFIGCTGFLFGADGTCTLVGNIDSPSTPNMVDAYIDTRILASGN